MKKVLSIIVIFFSLITQGQNEIENPEKLTIAQKSNLTVEKMAMRLNLTEDQKRQIKPLITELILYRRVSKSEKEELVKKANIRLNKMLAFKKQMKTILNKEQFAKFEKKLGISVSERSKVL